ncbi:zf-TFIIB domain-containing protein [Paracoccus sp. (in: a-proteobacteria)]|uniref:TFIIB-type zinc ribbon-containing protein n=1 Tax=Paracoccus sp. TaxID=267 RepID=UPI0032201A3E
MKCPTDNTDLVMSERQGIEIDYCPACRGVWLDRGELDKIIERSLPATSAAPAPAARPEPQRARDDHDRYRDDDHDYRHKRKRRESFLGDLFDF